jgi:hypothetical protein
MRAFEAVRARVPTRPSYGQMTPSLSSPTCKCGNGKIDTCEISDHGGCAGVSHPCDPGPEHIEHVTEICDGADLGGRTCQSLGFASGTLRCMQCNFDTSGCVPIPPGGKTITVDLTRFYNLAANDDVLAVVTTDGITGAPIITRFDHALRQVAKDKLPAQSFDSIAASPTGFWVSTRNDDGAHMRSAAIFELPNGAPAKRAYALADGFVASLYPVRRGGRLVDPIAEMVSPKSDWQTMRLHAGAVPVKSAYIESMSAGDGIETNAGVLLPPKGYQAAIDRVHADGSVEHVALGIDCPVSARVGDGVLAYQDAATGGVKLLPVDEDLRAKGEAISIDGSDVPTFLGDILWYGANDFARASTPQTKIHILAVPNVPGAVVRFGNDLGMTVSRGLLVIRP